jgi:hypothetical protein
MIFNSFRTGATDKVSDFQWVSKKFQDTNKMTKRNWRLYEQNPKRGVKWFVTYLLGNRAEAWPGYDKLVSTMRTCLHDQQ